VKAKKMIIYKATNLVNNKIYIGQTICGLEKRKSQHERAAKYGYCTTIFDYAINKYGKENFKWEIIDTAETIEELNEKEFYYIQKENSMDKKIGYNLKAGGKNSYLSDCVKQKIGDAQRGEKNHMYGKTGADNPTSKPVKNITTGEIYESASMCANHENKILSHICSVCRGERGSVGGCVYRYIDKNNEIIIPEKATRIKQVKVKNIELNTIYESAAKASLMLSGNKSNSANILKVCNKQRKTALNYHWEFVNSHDANTEPSLSDNSDLKV